MQLLETRHLLAVLSPGGEGAAGLLEKERLELTGEDRLLVELGGAASGSYDRVQVAGAAAFAGALEVRLLDGFTPEVGQTFDVVSSVGSSGAFSELVMPELADGKRLVPVLKPGGVTLVVANAARPTGGSQLRLPDNAATSQLTKFLSGIDTSVTIAGAGLNVLGQEVRGDLHFGAGLLDNAPVLTVAASNVSASLGDGLVELKNGSGSFFLVQSGVAGSASAELSLHDDLSLRFSGTFGLAINTTDAAVSGTVNSRSVDVPAGPYFRVEAIGAELAVAGQSVSGNFVLETQTIIENTLPVRIVRGGASDVSATLGSQQAGVQVSQGQGGFVLRPDGIAAAFSGDVKLLGVSDDLHLSGAAALRINTTGIAVNETLAISDGQEVTLDFSDTDTDQVIEVAGALDLKIANFLDISGAFAIRSQSIVANSPARLLVGVREVNAFFGDAGLSNDPDDDVGMRISDGTLGLVLEPSEPGEPATYALAASGAAALVGVQGLALSGTAQVRKNTTGKTVDETIGGVQILFEAGEEDLTTVGGTLDLDVGGFVTASGSFGVERSQSVTENGVTISKLKLGVSDLTVFLGDPGSTDGTEDDTGLRVTGGELGLVIYKQSQANAQPQSSYALYASGNAALVGVEGLDLSASVAIRKNTTGKELSETVQTPGKAVPVIFEAGEENLQSFAGSLDLNVSDFVSLSGGFSVSKVIDDSAAPAIATKLVIGASVSGFFGNNSGTDDALGIEVNDASLGLVLHSTRGNSNAAENHSSYALHATTGNIELVGVDGLTLGGSLQIRINNTGSAVDESIDVPGRDAPLQVSFDSDEDIQAIGGALELGIGGFTLSGGFGFEKRTETVGTKTTTSLLIGAAGVTSMVGVSDGGSPLGIKLSDGTLAMKVLKTVDTASTATQPARYAVDARGSVELIGLPLNLSGTFGLLSSNLGTAAQETITVPNPQGGDPLTASLDLPANQPTTFVGEDVTLGIADVFQIGGNVTVSRSGGKLAVDIENAALALIVNQQEVIRLGGSAAFTLGGLEGFKLQSFAVGGSSFTPPGTAGATQAGGTAASTQTQSSTALAPPSAPATSLGPLSFSNPSISVGGFELGRLDIANKTFPLSITVGVEIGAATLNLGNSALTATAKNLKGSFGVGLQLSAQSPFVSDVKTTGQWSLQADELTIGVGQFLELKGTGLKLDPGAGPDEDLVSFASAGAKITAGNVAIAGSAKNFAIQGDGDFVAKTGFGVSLSMTNADPLGLPLPLQIQEVAATWSDFNARPADFQIAVSASINGNFGPVQLSGSVDRMVLDVAKLRDGQFPIVDMAGFTASASGNLFGGKISGSVIGGVVKFDADGDVLPSSATEFEDTVFYGGIIAGFEFAGAVGAEIRVGFSELGFLSGYLTTSTPAGILLDPVSGLSLKDFRGGFEFNASPLTPPESPRALATDVRLKPTTGLTADQWRGRLIEQVARQAAKKEAAEAGFDSTESIIRIEAGATLYSQHVSENIFKADVDIIITTSGQFAIVGKGVIGSGAMEADVKLYGDLSSLSDDNPDRPLQLLFLADMTTAAHKAIGAEDPLMRLEGEMTFAFFDVNGNLVNPALQKPDSFQFRVLGRATYAPLSFAKVIIGGSAETLDGAAGFAEIKLTVVDRPEVKRMTLDFSGSLSIDGLIKADDLISAAGQMNLEKQQGQSLEIWGAAQLDFTTDSPGLSFLKEAGFEADANFLIGLNLSGGDKEVELALPGRPVSVITIPEDTVLFEAQGSVTFKKTTPNLGDERLVVGAYLEFDGAFSFVVRMHDNGPSPLDNSFDFELFVAARLSTGVTLAGKDLKILEIDALGLVVVTNLGFDLQNGLPVPRVPTIAARLDLSVYYTNGYMEFDLEKAQLLLNTTGSDVIYVVPERLQDRIATLQSRREKTRPYDPTFLSPVPIDASGNLLQTNSAGKPIDSQGNLIAEYALGFVIAGAPTDASGNAMTAGPYVQLVMQGSLTIVKAFKLQGAFRIMVGAAGFELGIAATARLALPGAENLLSAQATGLLRISDAGMVGGVTLAASFAIPGINLDAGVQSYFGINTTGTAQTLSILPVGFDPVLAPRSAIVYVEGTLKAGGLSVNGLFSLEVNSESIQLMVNAGMNLFNLGRVAVSGKAGIFYGERPGLVLSASVSANADFGVPGIFDIGGDLKLEINSRAGSQKFEIALENARVKLLHVLEATGSGRILAQDGYFRMEGAFRGSLLSIVTVDVRGFFDSLGNFELYLGAGFKLGTDSWGIRGGGHFHILRDLMADPQVPLALSAGLYGEIRAGGRTLLGADIGVDYASPPAGDGKIRVEANIKVLFITIPIRFTLGYLRLSVPELPRLGDTIANSNGQGRTLLLNVGKRASLRHADASPGEKDEQYIIDAIGPGSQYGEKIRVQAFGSVQIFDNVTAIEALDDGGFGDGDDQLILGESLGTFRPIHVRVDGGDGDDLLINQSSAIAVFKGGKGNDVLLSDRSGDTLDGGEGDNEIVGGAGTIIIAGDGNNLVTWDTSFGAPASITFGSGNNRLRVLGTGAADTFVIGGSSAGVTVSATHGQTTGTITAAGVKTLEITGGGGADTLDIHASGVNAAGLTKVIADLGRVQGKQQGSDTVTLRDDGAADITRFFGTDAADDIVVSPAGEHDVQVALRRQNNGQLESYFTLTLESPNVTHDRLVIDGGKGDDRFSMSGVTVGSQTFAAGEAARRVRLELLGGEGDDIAVVPLSNVSFDGGAGNNRLTFLSDPSTHPTITLSDGRIATTVSTGTYRNVNELILNTQGSGQDVVPTVTVVSTHTQSTSLKLGLGTVTVNGTKGPLDVTLNKATSVFRNTRVVTINGSTEPVDVTLNETGSVFVNGGAGALGVTLNETGTVTINGTQGAADVTLSKSGTVMINETSAPVDINLAGGKGAVTINGASAAIHVAIAASEAADVARVNVFGTGSAGAVSVVAAALQATTVVLGGGLLSRVGAAVSLEQIRRVVFDNSLDVPDRSYTITDAKAAITGPGVWDRSTLKDVYEIELLTGFGDDTIASTIGRSRQIIDGGAGKNILNVTLSGAPADLSPLDNTQWLVSAKRLEQVNFTNTGNDRDTAWALGRLTGLHGATGNDLSSGSLRLLTTSTGALNVTFGAKNDTVDVAKVMNLTTIDVGGGSNSVTVGGGKMDNLHASLHLLASASGNSLIIDDQDSPSGVLPRHLTIAGNVIDPKEGKPITYDRTRFNDLTLKLGKANDVVDLRDLPGTTTLRGGAGDDQVFASGSLSSLSVFGEAGNDTLTLLPGSGTVTFHGGDGIDKAVADRSDALTSLSGSLKFTNGQPVLKLTGTADLLMPTSAAELIDVKLGAGNDTFEVDSKGYNPNAAAVYGGAGDDRVTFRSVGGDKDKPFTVHGQEGLNTVEVIVSATPTADQFIPVIPLVQRLIVDHRAGTAATAWTAKGYLVQAKVGTAATVDVIDAEGAERISILGGSSTTDSLTITGTDPARPLEITLNGQRADVFEGLIVLSPAHGPLVTPEAARVMDGLEDVSRLTASTDGKLVFALGSKHISVFRTDGAGGKLGYVDKFSLPTGETGVAIAARPDGKWVFVATTGGLRAYEVDAFSGAMTLRQSVALTHLTNLGASPDGKTLVAVRFDLQSGVRQLVSYQVDALTSSTSTLSVIATETLGSSFFDPKMITFADDSSKVYVASANTVSIFARQTNLSYKLSQTLVSTESRFAGYQSLQLSDDGKILFGFAASPFAGAAGVVDYYQVLPNGQPVYKGTINSVLGWRPHSDVPYWKVGPDFFKYDSVTGWLAIVDVTDRKLIKFDTSTATVLQTVTLSKAEYAVSTQGDLNIYPDILAWSQVEVGRVGTTSYAVWSSAQSIRNHPQADPLRSGLSWTALSSAPGDSTTFTLSTGRDRRFVHGAVISDAAGQARILGVQHLSDTIPPRLYGSVKQTDLVVYDIDGSQKNTLTIGGTRVLDIEVYPDPTGLRNVWWSLEESERWYRSSLSDPWTLETTYNLRRYVLGANGIAQDGQIALPSAFFGRIRFSPDGSTAYLIPSSGSSTVMKLTVGANGALPSSLPDSAGPFVLDMPHAIDLAVRNDAAYAAISGISNAAGMTYLPVSSTGVFDTAQSRTFVNSDFNVSSVAVSQDQATIYVSDTVGKVRYFQQQLESTWNPVPVTNRFDVKATQTLPAEPSGATGSFDIVRSGRYLIAGGTSWYAVDLGSANGTQTATTPTTTVWPGWTSSNTQRPSDIHVAGGMLLAAFPDDNLPTATDRSRMTATALTGLTSTSLGSTAVAFAENGRGLAATLTGAVAAAVSRDNGSRYLYALSPVDNALGIYDREKNQWTSLFDGFEVPFGTLTDVSAIVVNRHSGVDYAAVVSPSAGTLAAFRTQNGVTTVTGVTTHANLLGVKALAFAPGANALYTMTGTKIRRHTINADFSSLGANPTEVGATGLTGIHLGNGRLYAITDNGSKIVAHHASDLTVLASISGLSNVTDLAFVGSTIYASSSDGVVYHLEDTGSAIVTRDAYWNNSRGIRGLGGASSVAVSPAGDLVFVAGGSDNAIAVFTRNATTGALTFVQAARDGRTIQGAYRPSDLIVLNDQLIVASPVGRNASRGGFAVLDVAALGAARPINVQTDFTGVESLTLSGSNEADLIRIFNAALPTTVNAGKGDDAVTVYDLGPRGTTMTITGGEGNDTITVNQSLDRSAGTGTSTLSISGGLGNDQVNLQNLASHSTVIVSVNQGNTAADIDVVRVRGVGVPSSSTVTVQGDLATGSGSSFAGDALIYDGNGATFGNTSATKDDTITLSGFGTVSFTNLYKANPQQVFLVTAPRPTLSVQTIAEGDSVTLTAGEESNQPNIRYDWDLNGDGEFTNATGKSITLTWAQLRALGINDGSRSPAAPLEYPIAVRASVVQNAVLFGGQAYHLFADAAAQLKVTDTPPTLAAIPGSATIGVPFTIPLSATDPGDDRVYQWTINWGDGTTVTLGASATSASHVYTAVGDFTVTVTATDEDGATTKTGTVQSRPGVGSVAVASHTTSLPEGGSFTATAGFVGAPVRFLWDFGANSTIDATTTTATLSRTWEQLKALGVDDNGNYQLRVTAVYSDGTTEYSASSAIVSYVVSCTAPTGSLTLSETSVPEGSAAGAITVSLTNYADPSPKDTASTARVSFDFDNDGTIDLADQLVGTQVNVPASFLRSPGPQTVRAVLRDKDGASREVFGVFNVTPVAPVLSVSLAHTTINEGEAASLSVGVTHPVGVTVDLWRIKWGDGAIQEIEADTLSEIFTHVYANGAIGGTVYGIEVTALTSRGELTVARNVTVQDVAPTVLLAASSLTAVQGAADPVVVTLAITDPGDDVVLDFVIDWGDGTMQTLPGNATFATHTYRTVPTNGIAAVRIVSLTDTEGTFSNPSNTLMIAVANAPPVFPVLTLGGPTEIWGDAYDQSVRIPASGLEGSPIDLAALAVSVATGTEPLTFHWTITAPDGEQTIRTVGGVASLADPAQTPGFEYVSRDGFTFTPVDDGEYAVTLTVTDESGASAVLTRTITVANVAPTIDSFSVPATGVEGETLTFTAVASDPGIRDVLTYTWIIRSSESGAVVATLTGQDARFTPYGGEFVVQLNVADGNGGVTSRLALLSVPNNPPSVVTGTFDVPSTSREGDTSTFRVEGFDAGGAEGLTYRWRIDGPNRLLVFLDGPQVQYTWPDDGLYRVSVTITDRTGASVTAGPATVDVANLPPTITSFSVPSTGTEGMPLSFSATATDPAGPRDAISFRWTITGPGGAVVIRSGSDPTFTPPDNGIYSVALSVFDEDGGQTTQQVGQITVANVDPVVGAIIVPTGPLLEGQTVQLSVPPAIAVPADLPSLEYLWTITTPGGIEVNFTGRQVDVPLDDSGTYLARLVVRDKDGGQGGQESSFSVANVAPAIQSVTVPQRGYVGFDMPLAATATDVSGDLPTLRYTWTITKPDGTSVSLDGAAANFVPTAAGAYSIELKVMDKDGGEAIRTRSVTVLASTIAISSFGVPAGTTKAALTHLTASATDAFGAAVTYTWTITPPEGKGAPIVLTGANVSFAPLRAGTHQVTLRADSLNGTQTLSADLPVANVPPRITSVSVPGELAAGAPVNLSATATSVTPDPLVYTWTIRPPVGLAFELSGTDVQFTPQHLGVYGIELVVRDIDGGQARSQRVVSALKAATTLSLVPSTDISVPGKPVQFTATVSSFLAYLGIPAGTVTFRDGNTVIGVVPLTNGVASITHVFQNDGVRQVSATYSGSDLFVESADAKDQDVRSAALINGALFVGGTNGPDTIFLRQVGSDGVGVNVNEVVWGPFMPTGDITVYGLAGNDVIDVGAGIERQTRLYGGDGDDTYRIALNGNGSLRQVAVSDAHGANTLNVTGPAAASVFNVTPDVTLRGSESVNYTNATLATLRITGGNGSGNIFLLNETRAATVTTIDGGPSASDSLFGTFAGDLAGTLNLRGLESSTLNVGRDFTGTLNVEGTLSNLSAGRATPGAITADRVGTVRAQAATGPIVLQINEGDVQRRVEVATPEHPYPLLASSTASPAGVSFRYLYEGTAAGLAHPQLTARVTNSSPTAFQYDVSLVTWNSDAKFNLARIDASGASGIRNVAIEGDLLSSVTQAAASWLGSSTLGGVRLPQDDLAGVAIRDRAPHGAIAARSIQAVAFGEHRRDDGKIEAAIDTSRSDARRLLAAGTSLAVASNTFRIPFADRRQVALFYVESVGAHQLTDKPIYFVVQDEVVAANPLNINAGNIRTRSNTERGAATALVTVIPSFDDKGRQKDSQLLAIDIRGDGAAIDTRQLLSRFVTNEQLVERFEQEMSSSVPHQTKKTKVGGLFQVTPRLTSTGVMGDLNFRGLMDADVWVAGIFGSLNITGGPLTGVVQTSGQRIDPITGDRTQVSGDVGRLYVAYDKKGEATFETTEVQIGGGGLSGQLLVRGDLISHVMVSGGMSGVIATEGSIGVEAVDGPLAKRLGGITVNGGMSGGQIIALDSIFGGHVRKKSKVVGDVVINGGMRNGAQIGVQGEVASLTVNGTIDRGSAVVVGGEMASFTAGNVQGIVAAKRAIVSGKIGDTRNAQFFGQNLTGSNAAAVDAVFADSRGETISSFDDEIEGDLELLALVQGRLKGLKATSAGLGF